MLVTSRHSLAALVTHVEVRQIVLDVLSEGEAADLFAKMLGPQRVGREPDAVARLAALCGRMPLALRIAAAKLVAQPSRAIGALGDEVCGDDRLAHLGVEGGARTVEAVFATAYRALSEPARVLFRRLGRHPGPHVSAPLAAAMCGVSTVDSRRSSRAHLLVRWAISVRPISHWAYPGPPSKISTGQWS